jgi:putative transposase
MPHVRLPFVLLGCVRRAFQSRSRLLLENLVLRQQLAVFKRKHPRPRLYAADKFFWIAIRRFWSRWKQSLIVVSPDTVVRWHRAGFALYWRALSRARRVVGRKRISKAARDLIFRMTTDNPSWGAPRIHGELLMLGFEVSERTVSRWMRRAPRGAIAAMDFFTVPTVTFKLLYCFFVISHDRRRILPF